MAKRGPDNPFAGIEFGTIGLESFNRRVRGCDPVEGPAFRPVIKTFAPADASSRAVASPMPELPPVTIATLFCQVFD